MKYQSRFVIKIIYDKSKVLAPNSYISNAAGKKHLSFDVMRRINNIA